MRYPILIMSRILLIFLVCVWINTSTDQVSAGELLNLTARHRSETEPDSGEFNVVTKDLQWEAEKTAIVVCDMWSQHWCKGATKRVVEMAPLMNEVVSAARQKGVLIIHCPSGGMDHYKNTPMRKLAAQAPKVETTIELQDWCNLDRQREAPLPIDDSDGGCDCHPKCEGVILTPQIAAIEIKEGDAITDNAEAYYLMKQRGIDNVIVMGVHTNMCVLGRPFSIRQMVYQGQNVLLVRDLTDTMYNSRMKPFVPHVRGTDLVIGHIEKYWCPTITSTVFTEKPPLQFSEAEKPHVVFMIGEQEYKTKSTLPIFSKSLESRGLRCTIVHADPEDGNSFPGLKSLKTADLLFLSVRRRSLPDEQLALVRQYVALGKPVVGIRTASHAFHTRGEHPAGHAEWQQFDAEVFGGNYHGHHGNGLKTKLRFAEGVGEHTIFEQVSIDSMVGSGSLYKVSPLAKNVQVLMIGEIPQAEAEPVAWIRQVGETRNFYTSLGHPDDFMIDGFNRLLVNAVFWALDRPVPDVHVGGLRTAGERAP